MITVADAVERLGLRPKRSKLPCPFHEDKTPSLHLYWKTNSWTCFACHKTGDGYGLFAAYTGTSVADVLRTWGDREQPPSTVPKANLRVIQDELDIKLTVATQPLFDSIRHADLEPQWIDLLLIRASEWYDEIYRIIHQLPPAEQEAKLREIPDMVEALVEGWNLEHNGLDK